jgi:hypothetical protein
MNQPDNSIIILTHGWTGSSVFAALLGRAGYWLGSDTVKKVDYNTFENAGLVDLNVRLLDRLAPGLDHEHAFDREDVDRIEAGAKSLDLDPYRDFVARCTEHGAWVWKDPRLTWTIRVWSRVLDLERTAFLLLTRDDLQAWITANTRRHVQSIGFTRRYNHGITTSNSEFARRVGRPALQLSFEDLLLQPERTLDSINRAYGLSLGIADLEAVCDIPLYRKSRSWRDLAEAALVYALNFGERDGRKRAP